MASMSYRELVKLLEEHGCTFSREAKGSHEIWRNREGVPFTVSTSLKGEGTLQKILKTAGIK